MNNMTRSIARLSYVREYALLSKREVRMTLDGRFSHVALLIVTIVVRCFSEHCASSSFISICLPFFLCRLPF